MPYDALALSEIGNLVFDTRTLFTMKTNLQGANIFAGICRKISGARAAVHCQWKKIRMSVTEIFCDHQSLERINSTEVI